MANRFDVRRQNGFVSVAMLCFFLSRLTIAKDVARAETVPDTAMPTWRLCLYMFLGGALPGAALANASSMFFKAPPPLFWLQGLIAGGLVGVVLALMIAGVRRPAEA